jgi:hypothetical protein
LDIAHAGKMMISLLLATTKWSGKKSRLASIGEENQERREEEKLKEETKSRSGIAQRL